MSTNFQKGDHLVVYRGIYDHHGIYVGDDRVIHYAGNLSGAKGFLNTGTVELTTLEVFSEGKPIKLKVHDQARYTGEEVIERALSRLGEEKYNALFQNCEHFVNWCLEGVAISSQVQHLSSATSVASTAFMAAKPLSRAISATTGKSMNLSGLYSPMGIAIGAGLLTWSLYRAFKK